MIPEDRSDVQTVRELKEAHDRIAAEVAKVIIGQREVIDDLLVSILANGHCLLVGVPGLAKTMLVSTLARVLDLRFSRVQFTPDLMPSDITGTDVLETQSETGQRSFRFIPGPVFAKHPSGKINRTPPKTQAAAAGDAGREVTAGGSVPAAVSFFVLATLRSIEGKGPPLPEAQLDRSCSTSDRLPSPGEEARIVRRPRRRTGHARQGPRGGRYPATAKLVRRVPVAEDAVKYAVRLVRHGLFGADARRSSRNGRKGPRACPRPWARRREAVLDGRYTPNTDDAAVARATLGTASTTSSRG